MFRISFSSYYKTMSIYRHLAPFCTDLYIAVAPEVGETSSNFGYWIRNLNFLMYTFFLTQTLKKSSAKTLVKIEKNVIQLCFISKK